MTIALLYYRSSDNSADYALNIQHLHVQKPFTYHHGESTFDKYTEAMNLGTALIHDPDNFIKWENGADIQGKFGHENKKLVHYLSQAYKIRLYCFPLL